ncbi:hypothetical protein HDU97_000271 [Phlyctochytrium planicorne]|nr:hypothetical protein HDU97_000271 [Phlyctochytrium planicorne]
MEGILFCQEFCVGEGSEAGTFLGQERVVKATEPEFYPTYPPHLIQDHFATPSLMKPFYVRDFSGLVRFLVGVVGDDPAVWRRDTDGDVYNDVAEKVAEWVKGKGCRSLFGGFQEVAKGSVLYPEAHLDKESGGGPDGVGVNGDSEEADIAANCSRSPGRTGTDAEKEQDRAPNSQGSSVPEKPPSGKRMRDLALEEDDESEENFPDDPKRKRRKANSGNSLDDDTDLDSHDVENSDNEVDGNSDSGSSVPAKKQSPWELGLPPPREKTLGVIPVLPHPRAILTTLDREKVFEKVLDDVVGKSGAEESIQSSLLLFESQDGSQAISSQGNNEDEMTIEERAKRKEIWRVPWNMLFGEEEEGDDIKGWGGEAERGRISDAVKRLFRFGKCDLEPEDDEPANDVGAQDSQGVSKGANPPRQNRMDTVKLQRLRRDRLRRAGEKGPNVVLEWIGRDIQMARTVVRSRVAMERSGMVTATFAHSKRRVLKRKSARRQVVTEATGVAGEVGFGENEGIHSNLPVAKSVYMARDDDGRSISGSIAGTDSDWETVTSRENDFNAAVSDLETDDEQYRVSLSDAEQSEDDGGRHLYEFGRGDELSGLSDMSEFEDDEEEELYLTDFDDNDEDDGNTTDDSASQASSFSSASTSQRSVTSSTNRAIPDKIPGACIIHPLMKKDLTIRLRPREVRLMDRWLRPELYYGSTFEKTLALFSQGESGRIAKPDAHETDDFNPEADAGAAAAAAFGRLQEERERLRIESTLKIHTASSLGSSQRHGSSSRLSLGSSQVVSSQQLEKARAKRRKTIAESGLVPGTLSQETVFAASQPNMSVGSPLSLGSLGMQGFASQPTASMKPRKKRRSGF